MKRILVSYLTAACLSGMAAPIDVIANSPLEQLAQERKPVATFSDSHAEISVLEIYADGALLSQKVNLGPTYDAQVLILVKDGSQKSSEWQFKADIKSNEEKNAPVHTYRSNGGVEGNRFLVSNKTGPDQKKNPLEATLAEAAYEQSSMKSLEQRTEVGQYFTYFNYQLDKLRNPLTPKMPEGYNPLGVVKGTK